MMSIEVIWPWNSGKQKDYNLESLVEYQQVKFNYLSESIYKTYQKSNLSANYSCFKDIRSYLNSPYQVGFLICLLLQVIQEKTHKRLKVMDHTGVYNIKLPEESISLEKYNQVIAGIQVGLFLKKESSKHTSSLTGLAKVLKIDSNDNLIAQDYLHPQLDQFKWSAQSTNKLVLISDIHCGSLTFLKENFIGLVQRINQDPKIKYVVLNGDLVDGVDVYPDHRMELELDTFIKQYDLLGSILASLRKDIKVIFQPGNHDMVSRVEPQFFNNSTKLILSRYLEDPIFLSNPSYFKVDGVYFYLTHGTSYNSVIEAVPHLSSTRCVDVTQYLCKIRYTCPVRNAVPVRPSEYLYHVIPNQVNVISAGHMHNQGVKIYKGRLLVNTGAWQHLTPYMKLLGVSASMAQGVCVDLGNPKNYEELDLRDSYTDTKTYQRAMLQKEG